MKTLRFHVLFAGAKLHPHHSYQYKIRIMSQRFRKAKPLPIGQQSNTIDNDAILFPFFRGICRYPYYVLRKRKKTKLTITRETKKQKKHSMVR